MDLVTCISTEAATAIDSASMWEAFKAATIRIVEAFEVVIINVGLVDSAKIN
jgi:hypothetical protein